MYNIQQVCYYAKKWAYGRMPQYYDFLVSNNGVGPKGKITSIDKLQIGDVIQLNFNNVLFTHSLVVVQNGANQYNTLIAVPSYDTFEKSISKYDYEK